MGDFIMNLLFTVRKKITALLLSGVLLTAVPSPAAAGGIDPWAAAAGALGAAVAYKSCLADILKLGNNAMNQELTRQHDEKTQGLSKNRKDCELIDNIMKRLTASGDYALDIRSLPFRWQVNGNREFNACCYPTNYISINSGLMSGLCRQPDELAAVLGHEMTHGIEQHSAYNYAKAIAQYYGLTFLGMAADIMTPDVLAVLADYSIAKNVTLPAEYVADEGGFYLAASAGFNPGGAAAAMSRMAYCTLHPEDFTKVFEPYDHPDTDRREANMSKLMTEYSCGHVTVKNGREVYIDGILLLTADWTDNSYDNSAENAYLIAGGLARAFHDYECVANWNFRQNENGRIAYLDNSPAYELLKSFVERSHAEELLWEMVNKAYRLEGFSGARQRQRAAEAKRHNDWEQRRQKMLDAEVKRVKELRWNSDIYVDLGQNGLAYYQIDRFMKSRTREDEASIHSIIGRAIAYDGDFAGGLAECDKAIAMNSKDPYNYLNRADVYRAQGRPEEALTDCRRANEADSKNAAAYKMQGDILDELGRKAEAAACYRQYKKLTSDDSAIPEEYQDKKAKKDKKDKKDKKSGKEQKEAKDRKDSTGKEENKKK